MADANVTPKTGVNDATLRKRQQIDSSKRTMFIAVAVTAFASGIALVVSFFLVQQIMFHAKVVGAKQETVSTIRHNIETATELENNIRVLDTNQALNSVKINDESNALQVILDALPAEANADALGASLQIRFAGSVEGLTVENLAVDTTGQGEYSDEEESSGSSIGFTMSVSGSAAGLKELLTRFEQSIRVIDLTAVEVQAGSDRLMMNLSGRAYYEPAQTVELETKVVKP